MVRAFIALGSNIEPAENLRRAIKLLGCRVRVVAISTVYRTRPEERPEQADYNNCVVDVESDLTPTALKFDLLRDIEKQLGRERSADRNASRKIDLDLIVYDDLALDADGLTLPDPQILCRPFLAIPLYELAPDLVLTGLGKGIDAIAEALTPHTMQPLPGYSEALRKELVRECQQGQGSSAGEGTAD